MEPITATLLIFLVTIVGAVWLVLHIALRLIRGVLWGVSLPFRAMGPSPRRQPGLTLHRLVPRFANGKCGATLDEAARFCPRCGTQVAVAHRHQPAVQVSSRRLSRVA